MVVHFSQEKPGQPNFVSSSSNILLDLLPILSETELSIPTWLDSALYYSIIRGTVEICNENLSTS
jgi:hypothetical protein